MTMLQLHTKHNPPRHKTISVFQDFKVQKDWPNKWRTVEILDVQTKHTKQVSEENPEDTRARQEQGESKGWANTRARKLLITNGELMCMGYSGSSVHLVCHKRGGKK